MHSAHIGRRTLLKLTAAGAMTRITGLAANATLIKPPPAGGIPVAFLLSKGAVVIDFAGPWQVFEEVRDFSRGEEVEEVVAFHPYAVAATMGPIVASGGLTVIPNHTFETAPQPKVIVIPAQSGAGAAELAWLRKAGAQADVVMSVCTGVFILAHTGMLDGKSATTHHSSFDTFATMFPKIKLEREARFVDHGNVASSAGLSAGIDLALHIVGRYFGPAAAAQTARQLEYQGRGWRAGSEAHDHENSATQTEQRAPAHSGPGYVCPPCGCAADGRVFKKPGQCPACGMTLLQKKA